MSKGIAEKLQTLFDQYRRDLPGKIVFIENAWKKLQTNWEETSLEELLRAVHSLHGSAGTYGYMEISQAAAAVENYLKLLVNKTPDKNNFTAIEDLIKALKLTSETVTAVQPAAHQVVTPMPPLDQPKEIYIFDIDAQSAKDIGMQLTYYHYQIKQFNQFVDLETAISHIFPAAVILDIDSLSETQLNVLTALVATAKQYLPLLFVSKRSDLLVRLKATRAGGQGFFVKPIDFVFLANKLNEIFSAQEKKPYRVLIVEDSEALTDYFALLLQQAGMISAVVNDPLKITAILADFRPDLILMDLYMPECSGLELAAILRQQEAYTGIPIVYLSAEDDKAKQLFAINLGGDDFLTKPVQPEYLISIIKARAERAKILRSYMVRDSLTGLLNHTAIRQQLDIELARAKRESSPVSFIMMDIDQFKAINDTYGHLTGDRVIQSLCNLLNKRLRKTDLLGRYGGEEFAIILPGTDSQNAWKLCNRIREDFSQVPHITLDATFHVTFSAGVADYPTINEAAELVLAADKALYQAKQEGRNKIMIAE